MVRKLLGIIRAPFLLLAPASLAPVLALAWLAPGPWDETAVILVLVAGLCAHIAVNALNEYDDFLSGLDFHTTKTPFSGGSGTLVADNDFAPVALYVGVIALLVVLSIGGYFLLTSGHQLAAPGLLGVAIILAYTKWINRLPMLCLLAPGLGFGLLMVNLAGLVLTGQLSAEVFWLSLPVTFLVSNLLLVNQFPDVEADAGAGRRHLPVVLGVPAATRVAMLLLVLAYLAIVAGWWLTQLPVGTLLGLLSLPLAVRVAIGLERWRGDLTTLMPAMAFNVAVTLGTPLLMAGGMLLLH
ncbi:MAG: hypothetical protein CMK32_12160 [Porticoccaceae bacterium]|nr:hypothetical protein [Porticoccaceae bacterium]